MVPPLINTRQVQFQFDLEPVIVVHILGVGQNGLLIMKIKFMLLNVKDLIGILKTLTS